MNNKVLYMIACVDFNLNGLLNKIISLIKKDIDIEKFKIFIQKKMSYDNNFGSTKAYPHRITLNFNKENFKISNRQIIFKGDSAETIENYIMLRELIK